MSIPASWVDNIYIHLHLIHWTTHYVYKSNFSNLFRVIHYDTPASRLIPFHTVSTESNEQGMSSH